MIKKYIAEPSKIKAFHYRGASDLKALAEFLGEGYVHGDGTACINVDGSDQQEVLSNDTYLFFYAPLTELQIMSGRLFRAVFKERS